MSNLHRPWLTASEVRNELSASYREPATVVQAFETTRVRTALDTLKWGVALGQMSVLDAAAAVLRETVRTARAEEAPGIELLALSELGKAHARLGDYPEALPIFTEALAIAQRLAERRVEATLLGNIGMIHGMQDLAEPYAEYTRRAMVVTRELQDDQLLAHNKINLAGALTRLGRLDEAAELYDRATPLVARVGWEEGEALLLAGRGAIAGERGDLDTAEQLTRAANAILQRTGNIHQMARHLVLLGERGLRAGDPAHAVRSFSAALELAHARSLSSLSADASDGLSRALEALGDAQGALAAARASFRAREAHLNQRQSERTRVLTFSHELEAARRDADLAHRRADELERTNAALLDAQAEIVRSLAEKETLLREIHHRVKNNLQVVSSLLRLQAEDLAAGEARTALDTCVARVRSMALIHQQLYGLESLTHIDLARYAEELAETLRVSLAPTARLRVDAEATPVSVATAVPVGLVLNELLTNAFKYGLSGSGDVGYAGADCDVRVTLARRGDDLVLVVADNGRGTESEAAAPSGLGMQLVRALARQLRGRVVIESDSGTRTTLACPS